MKCIVDLVGSRAPKRVSDEEAHKLVKSGEWAYVAKKKFYNLARRPNVKPQDKANQG